MRYAETVSDIIGRTPLVRLNHVAQDVKPTILAKLECLNPGGSIKDRIGVAMIEASEREGLLRPGGTIVEATAGNTGVGLAMVATIKGYRCIFVLLDKMSEENGNRRNNFRHRPISEESQPKRHRSWRRSGGLDPFRRYSALI